MIISLCKLKYDFSKFRVELKFSFTHTIKFKNLYQPKTNYLVFQLLKLKLILFIYFVKYI